MFNHTIFLLNLYIKCIVALLNLLENTIHCKTLYLISEHLYELVIKYSLISLYTCTFRVYCQFVIIIFGSIHFVLRNFGFIFICICSLTFLVFKFDWLVLTGKQFSRPCRCLNITQKLEVSACLQQERKVRNTILQILGHICVNNIQT